MSLRRNDIAVYLSDPLDEGLGHSFCYIRPDPPPKPHFPYEPTGTPAFLTISGASISANTSTPLTTSLVDVGPPNGNSTASLDDKASAFESSNLFSSTPLQRARSGPIRRFPSSASGPIHRLSCSGLAEGGFLSGPIERSFISGPLENQPDQFQLQSCSGKKPKRRASFSSFKKAITKPFSGSRVLSWPVKHNNSTSSTGSNNNNNNNNSVSSRGSCNEADEVDGSEEEEEDEEGGENNHDVQWAQGKAGEDRVHIVISEEHGWVFVGIYDGFNGPDATDFLLNNLYSNVYKELKGLLWHDKSESSENSASNESTCSSCDKDVREKLRALVSCNGEDHHAEVLEALSEGLRKTEEAYLDIADLMLTENPELALMGSCVLVMLMKGEDVYLMNVGDSRAVLAQKPELDVLASAAEDEEDRDDDEFGTLASLAPCQLTMDHCTSVREEVERIKSEHPDDIFAVVNNRVKGSLKVTRAFGAGFLKQPKWNSALLQRFRVGYVGTSPYINCSPSLHHLRLNAHDKFLILSSDGLYQYFTNEEAVSEVESFMSAFPEGDPAQHLVEQVLIRAAKKAGMDFHELLDITQGDRRKYHDDVSIIIISFEGKIWRSFV